MGIIFIDERTVQTEIIDMLSDAAGIGNIGLLSPADEDYAINFAGGKTLTRYRDGSSLQTMNLQVQGKGIDQRNLANTLSRMCNTLTRTKPRTFPKTDEWEVRKVSVGTPPALKGLDETGVWYYACVLSVDYFSKNSMI